MGAFKRKLARFLWASRTRILIKFDLQRLRSRLFAPHRIIRPEQTKLHLGSGSKRLQGWLNADLAGADVNLDIGVNRFPFVNDTFESVVCQHVVEHLDMEDELLHMLREVRRVMKPGGEFWIATPDLEKICRGYVNEKAQSLFDYVLERDPLSLTPDAPPQNVVNTSFYERGLHKNLFDFDILAWVLKRCGFTTVARVAEHDLLERFPDFPPRNDDLESLYVRCVK
jgi:SAM-dependent methyltransferase